MTDRNELERPYRHPYRAILPKALQVAKVPRNVLLAVALTLLLVGVEVIDDGDAQGGWLLLAIGVVLTSLLATAWATMVGVNLVREVQRGWDEPSELADVRARRPHRAEMDKRLVHAEYAVTVEDDGWFTLWRFLPLAVDEQVPPGHVLVPGRPRYAADIVEQRQFDPDTTTAAEALVQAQADAAAREIAERDEAERAMLDEAAQRELVEQTESTAAALRHLTGQNE